MRALRLLAALAAVAMIAGWGATRANAATSLVSSDPVPRQELGTPPGGVSLSFDHVIADGTAKILVLNSAGDHVGVGDVEYWGSTISMQLANDLPKDTFTVQYRVTDREGVPEGGAFQFAVGAGDWTEPLPGAEWHGEASQPPGMANPDPYETGAASTGQPTAPSVEVVTATPTPTPPGESQSQTPTAGSPTATETGTPQQPVSGNNQLPWALGGLIVLAAAGVGTWLLFRSRGTKA